jgi:hypothetical protein
MFINSHMEQKATGGLIFLLSIFTGNNEGIVFVI